MAVLIDPPAWPAHGTLYGHLVSDHSLEELHDLAEAAGLNPRAFDRDHYDVPDRLYEACVAAGAVPTPSRTLMLALRGSGLRITKAQALAARQARIERLLARWPLPDAPELARDMVDRWGARGRFYHDLRHLEECLDALEVLGSDDVLIKLAIWFHDAIYEGHAGQDEEQSAQLAEQFLAGTIPTQDVAEVARLVRVTAGHQPEPGDVRGELLCDADLAILASATERYDQYRRDVRREYADIPLAQYRLGRAAVLDHLAALDPLYRTDIGRARWAASARANLGRERDLITVAG